MDETKRIVNVLFLGGAKRVSLARKLKAAGEDLNLDVRVFSYELTAELPIAAEGTVVVGKRWSDPELMDDLERVVRELDIHVMLPFVDAAVGVCGQYTAVHPEVWAPVVAPEIAEMLFDKALAAAAFEVAKIPVPATYRYGRPNFPLIAKPRHGSASHGIEIVNEIADFRRILKNKDKYMMQQYVENRIEFTVDCYVSLEGRILCVSPRQRIEVLGGEVTRTRTVDEPEIVALSRKVIETLGLRGAVTLQFLRDLDNGSLMLMEINPRLGGGVVCSIHAGGNIARLILADYAGMPLEEVTDVKPGVLICRYFDETVFNG